ncbi:MAG: M20/M25/M40 family metallo-hydrolase, partial [Chloroflexota bacterium]
MKTNLFVRGISFLLLFTLGACQLASTPSTPTASAPPTKIKTPTAAETISAATSTSASTATGTPETPAGQIAYAHIEALSEEIGPRVAGTSAEAQAAQYIVMEFERLGYVSELRPFKVTEKGKTISSANVIAVKPGASSREIIVGAHYDSVKTGRGADDNASGVAVILEVAERLRGKETPYTIRFVLFGAEELGLLGSKY